MHVEGNAAPAWTVEILLYGVDHLIHNPERIAGLYTWHSIRKCISDIAAQNLQASAINLRQRGGWLAKTPISAKLTRKGLIASFKGRSSCAQPFHTWPA